MAIQARHNPMDQARATLRMAMQVDGLTPTRMASRIGLNSAEELNAFLAGTPTANTASKVYRWLSVPVSAWADHMASLAEPEPESTEPIPDGFTTVPRARGGPQPVSFPEIRVHPNLSMSLGRMARCMLGNPSHVKLLTNEETRELLILPFGARSPESYRMSPDGHVRCTPTVRILHRWQWETGTRIQGERKHGGLLFRQGGAK